MADMYATAILAAQLAMKDSDLPKDDILGEIDARATESLLRMAVMQARTAIECAGEGAFAGARGKVGTWRTEDAGQSWTRVDSNEHPHGQMQIYQPYTSGVIFMPDIYSAHGQGILRSADFGKTWSRVGGSDPLAIVFGTPKRIYGMYAGACGPCTIDPLLQSAPAPGQHGWMRVPTPAEMKIGPALCAWLLRCPQPAIVMQFILFEVRQRGLARPAQQPHPLGDARTFIAPARVGLPGHHRELIQLIGV